MAQQNALKRNDRVPAGSQVCVEVKGPSGKFNADGQLVSATAIERWTNNQIVPGPGCKPLAEAASSYFVRVRVAFLTTTEVVIKIIILKPDASTHSTPHVWTVEGGNGDVAVRGTFIVTE